MIFLVCSLFALLFVCLLVFLFSPQSKRERSRHLQLSFEKKKKKKTVVSLATFVALQVWYGIPNERVPKSPLNSKERDLPRH